MVDKKIPPEQPCLKQELVKSNEINITKNTKYVQGNELNEAWYDLSAFELKLYFTVISLIKRSDTYLKEYEISFNYLAKIFDTNYSNIVKTIRTKMNKFAEKTLKMYNRDYKRYVIYPFFSRVLIKEEDHSVVISLNTQLTPFLFDLKSGNYMKGFIRQMYPFKSKYSIRIFNLALQHSWKKKRIPISLLELRNIFGIDENKYNKIQNFKDKVLDKAKAEIDYFYNTRTVNYKFTYENIKKGRVITGILFRFIKRPVEEQPPCLETEWKKPSRIEHDDNTQMRLYDKLEMQFDSYVLGKTEGIYNNFTKKEKTKWLKEFRTDLTSFLVFGTKEDGLFKFLRRKLQIDIGREGFHAWARKRDYIIIEREGKWYARKKPEKQELTNYGDEEEFKQIKDVPVDFKK